MWPFDYFRKTKYMVNETSVSSADALELARAKLPFPNTGKLYATYDEHVSAAVNLYTGRDTDFGATITFTLSRTGKKNVRKKNLESRLIKKK